MGRRLGQHFLADSRILDRIVDALDPTNQDVVIEIGPGEGTLTSRLAPRVGRVIAIEKDRALASALGGKGKGETGNVLPGNVQVVAADALRADWLRLLTESTFPLSRFPFPLFKVIGNIPYSITTPLIEKALTPPPPRVIVFLVQQEVADRLAAAAGSKAYGALSAGVQATARVERLFRVRAGAFRPPPKVDSALVRLTPLATPLVPPERHQLWRAFLARLFSQRRKQLGRSLRGLTRLEKGEVQATLAELDVNPEARPETLAPSALVRLFDVFAR